jgi:hypothetical protein
VPTIVYRRVGPGIDIGSAALDQIGEHARRAACHRPADVPVAGVEVQVVVAAEPDQRRPVRRHGAPSRAVARAIPVDRAREQLVTGGENARVVGVLDPPRSGAGREIIDLLAAAEVPRVVHIGCEAASFARDVGLYLGHGYQVEDLRVFDSFPLTHHIECVAVLTR